MIFFGVILFWLFLFFLWALVLFHFVVGADDNLAFGICSHRVGGNPLDGLNFGMDNPSFVCRHGFKGKGPVIFNRLFGYLAGKLL